MERVKWDFTLRIKGGLMAKVLANTKKVGIVIPVYNTPLEYFRASIEGALNQDYKNLEIMLVHDGNYTPCVEVSLEYARKDPRITVVIKPMNEGVAIARNIGIDYFSGILNCKENQDVQVGEELVGFYVESDNPYGIGTIYKNKAGLSKTKKLIPLKIDYIYFLDSDDVCHKDLVSSCLKHAKGANIVWFNFNKIVDDTLLHLSEHIREELDFLNSSRLATSKDWLQHSKEAGYGTLIFVWQVLIDFKFLQNSRLRFLNQVMREDNLFGICLLLECETMYLLPKKLIDYRVRTNGETNFASDEQNVFLPGFLRPLYDALGGDLLLTKHFYVALSWFIQKLYFVDFIQKYAQEPNIDVIINGMLNRFRNETMKFIHLQFRLDTDYYFDTCFNIFLSYIEELPNYDAYYRPFDAIGEYITPNGNLRQQTIHFIKEVLLYEDSIIIGKNKTIEELTKRIKELETKNTELKAKLGK